MKKRLLALALALMLVLTLLPSVAMAKEESFADVRPADWYYNAVCFAAENGLMSGTGAGFAPDAPTTRAMLWTILARLDGQTAKHTGPDWYAAAQLWAVRNDISDGTEPDGTITREQLAAMLYRFAQRKGLVRAASPADLSAFTDAASVSAYAQEAMQWAVANGLIAGMDGRLVPQGSATRAQIAQILSRMCEKWSLLPQSNAAILAGAGVFQPPEHKHTWSAAVPNSDGTHTSTCECGETMTEYCTLVQQGETESWSCSVCGFTVEGTADAGVSTWKELKEAVEAGKSPIYLANDIEMEATINIAKNIAVCGCGYTIRYSDSFAGIMFTVGAGTQFTTLGVKFDGGNKTSDNSFTCIEAFSLDWDKPAYLTLEDCELSNFKTAGLIECINTKLTVKNCRIKDNVLTSVKDPSVESNQGYFAKGRYSVLIWLQAADATLENVEIINNTATDTTGISALIYMKDTGADSCRRGVDASGLTMEGNRAENLILAWWQFDPTYLWLKSGSIKNNQGIIYTEMDDVTVGADMDIELNAPDYMEINNRNATAKCTFTNNGMVKSDIHVNYVSDYVYAGNTYTGRGDINYAGSGTYVGTITKDYNLK